MSLSSYKCSISCLAGLAATLGCGDSDSSSQPQGTKPATSQSSTENLIAEVQMASAAISARVDEMFQAVSKGQVQRVYDTFTSPAFRQVATVEQFKSLCDRVNTRLGPLRHKVISRFDVNPVDGTLVATAMYQAEFELGSGTVFVVLKKIDDDWLLLRLNVNAPELADDPSTFQHPTEVYVENSEPVEPGTLVDVLDTSGVAPRVILEDVRVLNVRWKVDNPLAPPKAPVKGFVTLGLKPDQTDAVASSKSLAVRPHQQ